MSSCTFVRVLVCVLTSDAKGSGFQGVETCMELLLGCAAAEKLVTFILGMASGSKPSMH